MRAFLAAGMKCPDIFSFRRSVARKFKDLPDRNRENEKKSANPIPAASAETPLSAG
jgi:hypothetical protein